MSALSLNLTYAKNFLEKDFPASLEEELLVAHDKIINKTGAGNDFLGWVNLPSNYDRQELKTILQTAQKVQTQSQAVIIIGIGGSYLGARAALEALRSPHYNNLPKKTPDIYFAGNNLSAKQLLEIKTLLGEKDFSLVIISKSGTTTEPAIAFHLLRKLLIAKYGEKESATRIFAITDKSKGVLKTMSDKLGYQTFVVPDDIGGRYSVLTAVGLLPLAIAGIDVQAMLDGAKKAQKDLNNKELSNPAWQYAAGRQFFSRQGKTTEIFSFYQPELKFFSEWWKQLFGESEGKEGKGIFPSSIELTTDLHSLGQYVQDGQRNLIETVLWLKDSGEDLKIEADKDNLDQLNFLQGKTLNFVNEQAFLATASAHADGGVPTFIINLEKMDEQSLGYLFYFFEFACALSAYLSGVNPFDQNGVEVYKQKMFKLLGKN